MSLYVICKSGFEYDDETYHRPESEGGKPVLASSDKDKAKEKCEELNFKEFCNNFSEMRNYFYDPDEQFSKEAIGLLKKNDVVTQDKHRSREYLEWDEAKRWQDIPSDDLHAIYKGCKLKWYEIYEVKSTI